MKKLSHENVMKLYEYYDTEDLIALVLELYEKKIILFLLLFYFN